MTFTEDLRRHGLERLSRPHYAQWVLAGIAVMILGYVGVLVASLAVSDRPVSSQLGESAVVVVGLVAWTLARRDRLGLAAGLVLLAMAAELHLSILTWGSLRGSGLLALPVLVMGTGLLLGGRVSFLVAGAFTVTVPLVSTLGRTSGIAPAAAGTLTDDALVWVTLVPTLFATAGLVHLALSAIAATLRAAQLTEDRGRELLTHAPDGILALDEGGRVTWLNPAAERILGLAQTEAIGQTLTRAMGVAGDQRGSEAVRVLLGQPTHEPAAISLVRDGTALFVEATAQRTERPDGTVVYQVVLRDVTARQAAEVRAGQLGRILEEALNEIFVIDPAGPKIVLASRGARENLGHERVDLGGIAPAAVNPALTADRLEEIRARVTSGGDAVLVSRGIHRRRDGSVYPVETRVQSATLEGRDVIVAFALDISDRVRAEEEQRRLHQQLEHAQRMEAVGRLAGGVAHDFNNLLMVVGGCAELLIEEGDEMTRGLAREIFSAQERGAALTRQLLAFARREVVQPKVLDLDLVLPETRPLLERLLGEQVRLEMRVEGPIRIVADRGQLEQILLNLAANARDAMSRGGTVTISARDSRSRAGCAVIEFSDDGAGMEPEVADRAFEPFFTSKPRGQGTGLGLSTVHGIVTQNGGTLAIDSTPGKGTTIVIHWPQTLEGMSEEAPAAQEVVPRRGRGRVLVVEDNDSARGLVQLILERDGFTVVTAPDAERGLEELRRRDWAFDLLLTDVVMPGRSGIELAEDVRALRPQLPILVMSGHLEDGVEAIPGVDPARDLILKPFRADELRARAREAIAAAEKFNSQVAVSHRRD